MVLFACRGLAVEVWGLHARTGHHTCLTPIASRGGPRRLGLRLEGLLAGLVCDGPVRLAVLQPLFRLLGHLLQVGALLFFSLPA